jgi:hypothetical protein
MIHPAHTRVVSLTTSVLLIIIAAAYLAEVAMGVMIVDLWADRAGAGAVTAMGTMIAAGFGGAALYVVLAAAYVKRPGESRSRLFGTSRRLAGILLLITLVALSAGAAVSALQHHFHPMFAVCAAAALFSDFTVLGMAATAARRG